MLPHRSAYSQHLIQSRLNEITSLIKSAQSLDLAFLFDATGSMQPHIDSVKDSIVHTAAGICQAYPQCIMRVAFAVYRDYDDSVHGLEKCDFTHSFKGPTSAFVRSLSAVRAFGGGDSAEDVFSGLEKIGQLSWESTNRIIIHIADAPCHGSRFHNNEIDDYYPRGDKYGRDITKLLQVLREVSQISAYSFQHLNNSTRKMIQEFKKAAGRGDWIYEGVLGKNPMEIAKEVVTVCSKTISRTLSSGKGNFTKSKYVPCMVVPSIPSWNLIPSQLGKQYKSKWCRSLDDLLAKIGSGGSLECETMGHVEVRIAPNPFSGEGATRWPFYAHLVDNQGKQLDMVVKRFKVAFGENTKEVHAKKNYMEQMEVQSVAAQMATEFNKCTRMLGGTKQVNFTLVSMLEVGTGQNLKFYNMEKVLKGDWMRYSNNAGYVNTRDYAATVQAFSHWTHERSNGLLMVTDLQGVLIKHDMGEDMFWLCDPAIHCTDLMRFTRTNFGKQGFELFYKSHKCNNICANLNLKLMPGIQGRTNQGTHIYPHVLH